ncbi:hypothetical protein EXN66_Car021381 [Channa argus]|uniref:Uncharacterized protein n=1 Tax=Channa argus TaxID=215402 RepID=A0A6G1QSJ1_CHAAH|nr:hypothetical protein EXN66_Car021381 [Channa argus]
MLMHPTHYTYCDLCNHRIATNMRSMLDKTVLCHHHTKQDTRIYRNAVQLICNKAPSLPLIHRAPDCDMNRIY